MKIIEKAAALSLPLIIILLGFPHVSETIYTPALPQMTQDLQTTAHLTELSLSIYFAGFALGVAFWGMCCDLLGRRPALLLGVTIYTIACLLLWNAGTIYELLMLRFIQGFGASAGSVVAQTMIRDLCEGKKRHQAFAIVGGALSFAPAIGPWIGGYLCMYFGWRVNFMVLTIMGSLIVAYCYLKLRETRPISHAKTFDMKTMLYSIFKMIRDKNLLKHVLFISAANGIVFGFYAEAPFLFIEKMGFTPSQYGLFGMILCVSGIIASFISHRLNEKMNPERIIGIGAFIALLGSLWLISAAVFDMFHTHVTMWQLSYIIFGIGITFLGVSVLISNSLSIALNDYKETLGIGGAIFGLLYYIGIALFMSLVSLLHNGTALPMPILFACYALSACAVSSTLLERKTKKYS